LMGQNGAGKTTIFGLILGAGGDKEGYKPESGEVHITNGATIATARQVIPREQLVFTVREFFAKCFKEKKYDLDPKIDEILEVVHLHVYKHKAPKEGEGPCELDGASTRNFLARKYPCPEALAVPGTGDVKDRLSKPSPAGSRRDFYWRQPLSKIRTYCSWTSRPTISTKRA